MARLPSADDRSREVATTISKPAPDIRVNIPDGSAPARAVGEVGRTLSNIGVDLARQQAIEAAEIQRIQKREIDRMENLRVEEAVNQLRGKQLELTQGQDGFANIKGADAVNRKNPLTDDYGKRFEDSINQIEAMLPTQTMKEKYRVRAQGVQLSYKSDLWRHATAQAEQYKDDVTSGTINTEEQMAAVNWFSPTELMKSKARLVQTIEDGYDDKPVEFVQGKILGAMQRVNSAVVNSMINSGQFEMAKQYITNNVAQMNTSDVIKYNGEITKNQNKVTALAAVESVVGTLPQQTMPNDMDRLLSLVAKQESGNRDYDAAGNVITSSAGARGRMQVMPGTGRDPGFGVKPAANDSLEELARVGRDYMTAMIQKYQGNVPMALAAYNYGPAAFDKAAEKAAKAGVHWMEVIPDETNNYVKSITGQYMAGENGMRAPTLGDVQSAIKKKLQGEPQEVIDIALKEGEARFIDINKTQTQASEDLLENIMARVDSGQLKSYDDLKPDELMTLGRNRVGARSYIESAVKRDRENVGKSDVAIEFYYTMMEDPGKLKNSSINDILKLSDDLGTEKVNSLLQRRMTLRTQPEAYRAAQVDSDQFKRYANQFGFKNSTTDKARLTEIRDEVEMAVGRIQDQEKRTLSREEKGKIIKSMMVEFPKVKARRTGTPFGMFDGPSSPIKLRGYQIQDPRNIIVPDDFAKKVEAAYKAAGRTASHGEILDAYIDKLMLENK
jgi:hypothetical protein